MKDLKTYVQNFKIKNELEKQKFDAEQKDIEAERIKIENNRNVFIHDNIRPATIDDYKEWLQGYIWNGGEATHYYDYNFPTDEFFVLKKSGELPTLYGSYSINIIIPVGLALGVEKNKIGHSNLYYMEDYEHEGHWVPIYKNL